MTNPKTKAEIARELIQPYIDDISKRSIEVTKLGNSRCLYNGPNGRHCAFANACINPHELNEGGCASENISYHGFNILKPEYRHIDNEEWWDELQDIHDRHDSSEQMRRNLNRFIREYCND